MPDPTRVGCVVVTVRADRERLVLVTPDGEIVVEITPQSSTRTRVVVRAPLSCKVQRRNFSEATP